MIRLTIFSLLLLKCEALIVPQELPSILSLVYSTIPQIKKGTDSRFGFGFRLGEHADFQVLVELGPQTETRAIGGASDSGSTNKRQVNTNDYKKLSNDIKKDPKLWLQNWSKDMNKKIKKTDLKQGQPIIMQQNSAFISAQALKELEALYKVNNVTNLKSTIT